MAKIEYTSGVGGIKGKIGGSVFAKNKGGYYVRQKVKPLNPKSPEQRKARADFTQVSQAWGTITLDNRKAWNLRAEELTFAHKKKSFGGRQKYSGKTLFQLVNNNRKIVALAQADVPPLRTEPNVTLPRDFTFNAGNDTLELFYQANPTATSYALVWATPVLSAGTSSFNGRFKQFAVVQLSLTADTYDITTQYKARFGSLPPAGSNIGFQIKQVTQEGYNGSSFEVPVKFA